MNTHYRVHLQTLVLLTCFVSLSSPVCVDVQSATTAILGQNMRLTCISCMKREEVNRKTRVQWYFRPSAEGNSTHNRTHILKFESCNENVLCKPKVLDQQFLNRLTWNGSQDLQDVSVIISNITYNDEGFYQCHILREFKFDNYEHSWSKTINISLTVEAEAAQDTTAIYSEIMMYVLLVFLTFWLLVEMVYCYRKISKSDEQAQDTAY